MSEDSKPPQTPNDAPEAIASLEREFKKFWANLEGVDPKAELEQHMKTSPWLVVGAVGFVGLVLGFLLGGRKRK